jgi:hypothetical protein
MWLFVLDQTRTVARLRGLSLLAWSRRVAKVFGAERPSAWFALVSGLIGGSRALQGVVGNPLLAVLVVLVAAGTGLLIGRRKRERPPE